MHAVVHAAGCLSVSWSVHSHVHTRRQAEYLPISWPVHSHVHACCEAEQAEIREAGMPASGEHTREAERNLPAAAAAHPGDDTQSPRHGSSDANGVSPLAWMQIQAIYRHMARKSVTIKLTCPQLSCHSSDGLAQTGYLTYWRT